MGGRGSGLPSEKNKVSWHLSTTGHVPLKNHKATKPVFNVGKLSARQRNDIYMAFRWRVDDDPVLVVFGTTLPSSTKKE